MIRIELIKPVTEYRGVTIFELARPLEFHGVTYPYMVKIYGADYYCEIISDAKDKIDHLA